VLAELGAGLAEKLFGEFVAAAEGELFGEYTEGVFGGDEVDVRDAVVGGEGTDHLGGIDGATGSGDSEGDVARSCVGFRHEDDYRLRVAKCVGDDGLAVEIVRCIKGFVARGVLCGDGGVELAGGDLFSRSMDIAELACGEVAPGSAHRWAEGSADDGARFVEIAGSGRRIEDWAGFGVANGVFIGEERSFFVVFVKDAGSGVAWEEGSDASERSSYAFADRCSSVRIGVCEGLESVPKTRSVLLGDWEDSVTALGTAWATDEVRAAAQGGRCEGGVYDLDESGQWTE
jgi:hypothetical protein